MSRLSAALLYGFVIFVWLPRGLLAARPSCCGKAEVFAEESERFPEGKTQAVELCRFITAYKVGLEGLVDATPYSPLLKAAAEAGQEMTFWVHIDTWVGNSTGQYQFYVDRLQEQCYKEMMPPGISADGNGWDVSADLVFWPEEEAAAEAEPVSTQPFESITLASGHFGDYHFGDIDVQEGVAVGEGREVALDEPGKLHPSTVEDAVVVQCPTGKRDIEEGVEMLEYRHSIEQLASEGGRKPALAKADEFFKKQAERRMSQLQVTDSDPEQRLIIGGYEKRARPRLGTEVFLDYQSIMSEECDQSGVCDNVSYPFVPVGRITRFTTDGKVEAKLDLPCIPSNLTQWTPRFRIPDDDDAISHVRKVRDAFVNLIQDVRRNGIASSVSMLARNNGTSSSPVDWVPQLLVHAHDRLEMNIPTARLRLKAAAQNAGRTVRRAGSNIFGRVRQGLQRALHPGTFETSALLQEESMVSQGTLEALSATDTGGAQVATELQAGDKVCLLTKRRQGRLFVHNFTRPSLAKGERAVLQVAFSGHGWSGSEMKCGEFCHMSYRLEFDGEEAGNVSVWRGDCASNPINNQYGTYQYARNGWCPGTVVPGLYIDVTDPLNRARQAQGLADGEEATHTVALYVAVRPEGSRHYGPYTNIHMFPGLRGDIAKVYVGMTLFLYRAAAVAAILAREKAVTAAEKAIRDGISNLKAWVTNGTAGVETEEFGNMFMEMGSETSSSEAVDKALDHIPPRQSSGGSSFMEGQETEDSRSNLTDLNGTSVFDIEKRFPWYLYDNETEGAPGAQANVVRVSVLTSKFVQFPGARLVTQSVPTANFPKSWSRVQLHLKLFRPPHLHYDHWDRAGSMGLFVNGHVVGA